MSRPAPATVPALLADDRPLVRGELLAVLDAAASVRVVGDVDLHGPVAERVEAARVALVVVGVETMSPDVSAVVAALAEAVPGVRLLVVGDRDEVRALVAALLAGAIGYLVRGRLEALDEHVRRLLAGRVVLDAALGARLDAATGGGRERTAIEGMAQLTARERDVLALLTLGLTNAGIADRLGIGRGTVKIHVEHLVDKLGAANRTHAAAVASRLLPTLPEAVQRSART